MTLFFGCRLPSMQLYREEIERMREEGVLRDVFTAFSRRPDQPKVIPIYIVHSVMKLFKQQYVQDFLLKQSSRIYDQLFHQQGHFYVCGDVSMAEDVCKTLKQIFKQNGIDDPDQALINLRVGSI